MNIIIKLKNYIESNIIIIIISFIIYTIFFCKLGNTCYRTNSEGIKKIMILPLFTEGFIGPIRTIFYLLMDFNLKSIYYYLKHESFNLANPITSFIIIKNIYKIIKYNKII